MGNDHLSHPHPHLSLSSLILVCYSYLSRDSLSLSLYLSLFIVDEKDSVIIILSIIFLPLLNLIESDQKVDIIQESNSAKKQYLIFILHSILSASFEYD